MSGVLRLGAGDVLVPLTLQVQARYCPCSWGRSAWQHAMLPQRACRSTRLPSHGRDLVCDLDSAKLDSRGLDTCANRRPLSVERLSLGLAWVENCSPIRIWHTRVVTAPTPHDSLVGVGQPHGEFREGGSFRPDVQGLRAIAVCMVVAFHSGLPIVGGFTGVDVFFVISGFVITAMLLRELAATGSLRAGRFFARRIKRIMPALAAMTTLTSLGAILLASPFGAQQVTGQTALGATFVNANYVIFLVTGGYFDTAAGSNPLLHTWSLSVEEQFYVVFPFLVLGAWKWGARRRTFGADGRAMALTTLFMVTGLSFLFCVALSYGLLPAPSARAQDSIAFYSAPSRGWEFGVGALVALAVSMRRTAPRRVANGAAGLGFIGLAASALFMSGSSHFPGLQAALPVSAAGLLLWAGASEGAVTNRWLSSAPMVWLGDLSYSWYLWHWPFIVFAKTLAPGRFWVLPAAAVLSLLPAWLSLHLLENPLRQNLNIVGRRVIKVAGVTVAIPTAFSALLLLGGQYSWGSPAIAGMAAQVVPLHAASTAGCDSPTPLGEQTGSECSWNLSATGSPLYLLGDSSAGQLTEAAVGASRTLSRPLSVGTLSACPVVDGTVYSDGRLGASCRDFLAGSVESLASLRKGVVLVSSRSDAYINSGRNMPRFEFVNPSGSRVSSPEEKAMVYTTQLTGELERLKATGQKVLFVRSNPYFLNADQDSWTPAACPNITVMIASENCGMSVSLTDMRMLQRLSREAEDTAIRLSGVASVDFTQQLCSDDVCATNNRGTWIYRDGTHLTVAKSRDLAPVLADAIRNVPS